MSKRIYVTNMDVSRLISPEMLVEIEAEAILEDLA